MFSSFMQVRHYLDSYISASAYTNGCSSTHLLEADCFGPTRFESRFGFFLSFCICFVLCVAIVTVSVGGFGDV